MDRIKSCYSLWIFLLYMIFTVEGQKSVEDSNDMAPMTRLVGDLFEQQKYYPDLLPSCVAYNKTPVVKVDMAIRSILDVDEPRQIVTANVWLRWVWDDCRLVWNKTDYEGVEFIIVSAKRVWIPDIELYDSSADGGDGSTGPGFEILKSQRVRMFSNGTVQLLGPAVIKFTCKMNVAYFPFDYQICKLKFASWSHTRHELDLINVRHEADMSLFVENGEWKIIDVPAYMKYLKYPCCEEKFPEITFFFIMRRGILFYMFNLVMPCMLITTVGMLVFWLPPDSGEKVSLGVTILLSLVVFLLIVSDKLPSTSDTVPLIAFYFASTMILISLSCGVSVLVWNLHSMDPNTKVPPWLRKLAKYLSTLCFVKYKVHDPVDADDFDDDFSQRKKNKKKKPRLRYKGSKMHMSLLDDGMKSGSRLLSPFNTSEFYFKKTSESMDEPQGRSVNSGDLLDSIHDRLKKIEEALKAEETQSSARDEWKCISLVVDRMCFVVIFGLTVLLTVVVFVNGHFRSITVPTPDM